MHGMPSAPRSLGYAFLTVFCIAFFSNCAFQKNYSELPLNRYPIFIDDLPKEGLLVGLDRHLHYLSSQPDTKMVFTGDSQLTFKDLKTSLTAFADIIESDPSPIELDRLIRENFTAYKAKGRKSTPGRILLTGYYEPVFEGSLTYGEPFIYPLYRVPKSLVIRKNKKSGKTEIGRISSDGTFTRFWSRKEIESTNKLSGNELVYLKDPLDAYLLHVQGSGRVRLPDHSVRSLHFDSSNGLDYYSLGKLLVDEQRMTLEEVSVPSIRTYFTNHPEEMTRMLHHNPRYIFFKWGDNNGPRGSLGEILTPGRSVAVDQTIFPAGTIGYLISRKPVLDEQGNIDHWKLFSRFVLPQDSGSAIKGTGRVDLFMGNGTYAETAASHMREEGSFFLLIQNSFELKEEIR